MIATFNTRCGHCENPIMEGDEIEQYEGEWLHAGCVEELEEEDEAYGYGD